MRNFLRWRGAVLRAFRTLKRQRDDQGSLEPGRDEEGFEEAQPQPEGLSWT